MWCKRCGPVLGVKNTHKVRNTGAVLSGAFLFGKVEGYYCPNCGAKLRPIRMRGERTVVAEPIEQHDEAYWEAYVARVAGKPPPLHVTRVTPDGKWISFDDGEHFASTANLPPPPTPPPEQPDEPGSSSIPVDSGVADALLRLSELHRNGDLTDDEFTAAKGKLLSH